jgi:high-affinity nickel-transport protein
MNLAAILALGFFLGMRHATDADHVLAVSAMISRERSIRAAAPIGALWGLGHTTTVFVVGTAVILFGVVIPPRVGLSLEMAVAVMLVVLGGTNLVRLVRQPGAELYPHVHPHAAAPFAAAPTARSLRPLFVGMVHGLAGSAAAAILVLGAVHDPLFGVLYLAVFGVGTVAGMLAITTALALSLAAAGLRFARFRRLLDGLTGMGSVAFGASLAYDVAVVQGLFTGHVRWVPH